MNKQSGFTAIELLITLFIAAAFLMSGYQLYSLIMKDGGDAKVQAQISNITYDYLQRYKPSATNPCTTQTPLTNQSITVGTLSNVTVSVSITCPYTAITAISKVSVTIQYTNPQAQTIINSTYVKP